MLCKSQINLIIGIEQLARYERWGVEAIAMIDGLTGKTASFQPRMLLSVKALRGNIFAILR